MFGRVKYLEYHQFLDSLCSTRLNISKSETDDFFSILKISIAVFKAVKLGNVWSGKEEVTNPHFKSEAQTSVAIRIRGQRRKGRPEPDRLFHNSNPSVTNFIGYHEYPTEHFTIYQHHCQNLCYSKTSIDLS